MSIELRTVKSTDFVTQTIRLGGKVKKFHLGSYAQPYPHYLYRAYRLRSAERASAFQAIEKEQRQAVDLNRLLSMLEASSGVWKSLGKLCTSKVFKEIAMSSESIEL
ncbi:hypothetical protein C2E31_27955, partial [Rhodopirellula baltica]